MAGHQQGRLVEWLTEGVDRPEFRAETRRMVEHYQILCGQEPPADAGGHPSVDVHEAVGRAWGDWDKQRRAWATILAPRLLAEALAAALAAEQAAGDGPAT